MTSALPNACTLSPESFRRRSEELRQSLLPRVVRLKTGDRELSFALPLDQANVADAEAFVAYERKCCGFARFACRLEPSENLVWVDVTTDASYRAALREWAQRLEAEAPRQGGSRPWLALGAGGIVAAAVGLACCATPMVAIVAGLVGLSTAALSGVVDVTFGVLLVTSLVAVAYGVVKSRRGCAEPRCECVG